jgi:hypothetical protein
VRKRKPSDAGEGGEQGRARDVHAQPVGEEGAEQLDERGAEAGDEARVPRGDRVVRRELDREHDEEHVREHARRVDPVGERAHVGAPGLGHQPPRLPRVEQVPEEHADRGAGKDAAVHEVGVEAEHEAAEGVDDEELHEVVEGQAEEAVEVAPDEHARIHLATIPRVR